MKVKVVSAYVQFPMQPLHLSRDQYKDLGDQLVDACGENNITLFYDYPFEKCWAYGAHNLPPAQRVPGDRYATPAHNVVSNIVQHQRTTWAMEAAINEPDVDVWVWLDYGILKQGGWTGKPVTPEHIRSFLRRVATYGRYEDIPFPGIWDKGPVSDTGDNWRFCGSTHIWPREHLHKIHTAYRQEAVSFFQRTGTVPNDLPIWAAVESWADIPYRWYSANHDATQLTNFPEAA